MLFGLVKILGAAPAFGGMEGGCGFWVGVMGLAGGAVGLCGFDGSVRGLCVSVMDLWGCGMNLWVHNGSVHACGGFKDLVGHGGTKGPQHASASSWWSSPITHSSPRTVAPPISPSLPPSLSPQFLYPSAKKHPRKAANA